MVTRMTLSESVSAFILSSEVIHAKQNIIWIRHSSGPQTTKQVLIMKEKFPTMGISPFNASLKTIRSVVLSWHRRMDVVGH